MTSSYVPLTVSQGFGQETAINTNNTNIKTALDESKSRISSTNEAMTVDLDMNSNDILNVGSGDFTSLSIAGQDITGTSAAVSTLPAQASQDDKFLVTNGSAASWEKGILVFDTVALMAATAIEAGTFVRTQGHTTAGDGSGATYLVKTSAAFVGTPDDTGYAFTLANSNVAVAQAGTVGAAFTINVPSNFTTLQAALDAVSPLKPAPGVEFSINIETAHALTAGFRVDNIDLSHVIIKSVDATVTVAAGFTVVSNTDLDAGVPRSAAIAFLAVRAKMPEWNILIDMSGTTNVATAYELDHQSSGIISPAKGCINTSDGASAGTGCRVTTESHLHGYQCNFSGSNAEGIAATANSLIAVAESNLSGAGTTSLDVSRGTVAYANQVNCSGSNIGIAVRRSWVSCQAANCNSSVTRGINASIGSRVAATDSTFDAAPAGNAIFVQNGTLVEAGGSTKSAVALTPADINLSHFNRLTGDGHITSDDHQATSVDYLTADSPTITATLGSQQAVTTMAYATILDTSGEKTLYGGNVYGADVGLRITIDGTVVINDAGRATGDDSVGDDISIATFPPCRSATSLKVEAFNRSSITQNLGWKIYTS